MLSFYVEISTPQGGNLEETLEVVEEVEKYLFSINEIKHFVSYVGDEGTDIWSDFIVEGPDMPNKGRIIVELKEEIHRERTSVQIASEVRNYVRKIAGAEIKVIELEAGPPTDSPIYLKLKGENLETLENTAREFAEVLKSIEGQGT